MSQTPADGTRPVQPERLRPPSTPAQLIRASDSDRDAVARALGEAFADGRLTREEHADRLSQAMSARTVGELAQLTHDLPTAPPAPAPQAWPFGAPRPSEGNAVVVAIFGGSKRVGQWFVPGRVHAVSLIGGVDLDMRDAVFTTPVVDVEVVCLFGGVKVVVPDGVRLENRVVSIFGGADAAESQPVAGAPTVRVRGLCLFGGVAVKVKAPRTPPAQPERR